MISHKKFHHRLEVSHRWPPPYVAARKSVYVSSTHSKILTHNFSEKWNEVEKMRAGDVEHRTDYNVVEP